MVLSQRGIVVICSIHERVVDLTQPWRVTTGKAFTLGRSCFSWAQSRRSAPAYPAAHKGKAEISYSATRQQRLVFRTLGIYWRYWIERRQHSLLYIASRRYRKCPIVFEMHGNVSSLGQPFRGGVVCFDYFSVNLVCEAIMFRWI